MNLPLRARRQFMANSLEYVNGCAGKIKHPSKRHAIAARMQIIKASREDRRAWEHAVTLGVYKCHGHYHLGHPHD